MPQNDSEIANSTPAQLGPDKVSKVIHVDHAGIITDSLNNVHLMVAEYIPDFRSDTNIATVVFDAVLLVIPLDMARNISKQLQDVVQGMSEDAKPSE